MTDTIKEPARQTPIHGHYDVVILGGGPAGLIAASAAGRAGRNVLLVERYGFLGGMGTAAGVSNFCGLFGNSYGDHVRSVGGLADELLDRMKSLNGLNEPHLILGKIMAQAYDISAYKIAADALLADHGVEVLFHAVATGISMDIAGKIDALFVETKSGRRAIRGRIFIDASGDGDLAHWAGAPFEKGDGHGNALYPSSMFRLNGIDPDKAGDAWRTIPGLMEEAEASGRFSFPRKGAIVRPQKNPVEWRVNLTQLYAEDGTAIDGTDADALTQGEIQGRKQVLNAFEFLRTVPGFENSYIVEIAPQIGIRETRRIMGDYVLTEDDVLSCTSFEDSIGRNSWPVEAHVNGDVAWKFPDIPNVRGYNQLPYRMILPRQLDNVFVVGRCASMTHMGQSAARVTGACFAMGEAAAVAADIALREDVAPRDVDVKQLQDMLHHHGALI
jgi:glycine/D-amino acid oxidase-like deaminating enzyme